ncbi:uncharacterized protein MELLADRAFT_111912 [Melampsora larici-populina 98AG31]|uniref:Secreted protein n=1 Tax=Melampsora larici-populina (strain 98AG31 / pathotype 3-4-7) TaxID=747676 RepID=F4S4S5_MELLP|nr:uncharacterized protein MELLADRAFT_111912 [Melampsora larici-populina 98AG31]EGG00339.1 hypothetical protein MELLADRAFT_111912 [Melampsora larici-populina 98AG31]
MLYSILQVRIYISFLITLLFSSAYGQNADQVITFTRGSSVIYYTFTSPAMSYNPIPTGTIPNALEYWNSVHGNNPDATPGATTKDNASNSDAASFRIARLHELAWTAFTVMVSICLGVAAVVVV